MDKALNVFIFLLIVLVIFLIAYAVEKRHNIKNGIKTRILNITSIAGIGMFAAAGAILMFFDFPVPIFPVFYEMDFSELPIIICAYAFGPVAGVFAEFCKVVLKLLFKPTATAFVGEFANFAAGCLYVLPASILYMKKKTRKMALIASITAPIIMTAGACILNAFYLLPVFADMFHLGIDGLVGMGTQMNGKVNSLTSFVLMMTLPFNLMKGIVMSVLALLVYKPVHRFLNSTQGRWNKK